MLVISHAFYLYRLDSRCYRHESVIDRGQPRIFKAFSALSSPCVDLTLPAFNPADFKHNNCLTWDF